MLYGVDENRNNISIKVMMPVKPLNKLIRDLKTSIENTVQLLKLDDGREFLVTARQIQVDPCT